MQNGISSTQFIYGIVAGLIPPLLWLWFWLKENNLHPEPRATLIKCFFFGMAGVLVALFFQGMTAAMFPDDFHRYVAWAAIEELVKFGVAFFVAFNAGKMEEPIDAMIYMITAALGFAALENILFMLGAIHNSDLFSSIVVGDMRFIGAILVHVISSAMVGFMIAISFYSGKVIKILAGIVGLALATALHAAFNLSIINSASTDVLKIFATVWASVVILILIFEEIKGMEIREDAKHSVSSKHQ